MIKYCYPFKEEVVGIFALIVYCLCISVQLRFSVLKRENQHLRLHSLNLADTTVRNQTAAGLQSKKQTCNHLDCPSSGAHPRDSCVLIPHSHFFLL